MLCISELAATNPGKVAEHRMLFCTGSLSIVPNIYFSLMVNEQLVTLGRNGTSELFIFLCVCVWRVQSVYLLVQYRVWFVSAISCLAENFFFSVHFVYLCSLF